MGAGGSVVRWGLVAERVVPSAVVVVPTNILATRVCELEAAGVLSRLPLRHNTRAYALTDRGLALREPVMALGRWGGRRGRSHL